MATIAFGLAVPAEITLEVEPLRFGAATVTCDRTTACGWRYALVFEPDGSIVAVYAFLDHTGIVRARGPRERVLAVLASARPDWRGDDVVALAELWQP